MKRDGYKDTTIRGTVHELKVMMNRGVNLDSPEEVLDFIASRESMSYRQSLYACYLRYAKYNDIPINHKPVWRKEETPIRLPTEEQINFLCERIGGKIGLALRILRETGMRPKELAQLRFEDIDFNRNTIRVKTAKYGRAREIRVSEKLMLELRLHPWEGKLYPSVDTLRRAYVKARMRLIKRTGRHDLKTISLYSFRHWFATKTYRKTKDVIYTRYILGHKSLNQVLRYVHLTMSEKTEYICKTAKTVEEAKTLIEAGFEYVTEIDGVKLFRKPK